MKNAGTGCGTGAGGGRGGKMEVALHSLDRNLVVRWKDMKDLEPELVLGRRKGNMFHRNPQQAGSEVEARNKDGNRDMM